MEIVEVICFTVDLLQTTSCPCIIAELSLARAQRSTMGKKIW